MNSPKLISLEIIPILRKFETFIPQTYLHRYRILFAVALYGGRRKWITSI